MKTIKGFVQRDRSLSCLFEVCTQDQVHIPSGTEVTVTWNDTVHECEENDDPRTMIEKKSGGWYGIQKWHSCSTYDRFGPIPLCPFCGKKLED